ncbi:Heat shock protein 70 family [Trinorchestia longiramus]|nr:Heat shock protein 70 family [Trinorchestia longiramus]
MRMNAVFTSTRQPVRNPFGRRMTISSHQQNVHSRLVELVCLVTMADSQTTAIGIDLGTTNSCVAVVRNGRVEIIANDMGNRITSSFVAFTEEERHVGDGAKAQAIMNPENTIFDAKRLIGRQFVDPEVQKRLKFWPFKVLDASGNSKFQVKYKKEIKEHTPEEISAMVLSKMKAIAETFIGVPVKDAVITVPAYFNDSQRQATLDAGKIADLNVLGLLNEPTAAAIAYGFDQKSKAQRNILVFDLGGGTFDVAILSLTENDFEVIAVDGDTCLGGGDLDETLVEHFLEEIKTKYNTDLSGNAKALGKLRKACERAKRNLSSSKKEPILVECLVNGSDFKSALTRSRLNELCSEHFKKTMKPVDTVLKNANMNIDEIDEVILAGGSTRIPKIQELLKEKFKNRQLNQTINPDEAVAYGAAIHAANLCGEKSVEDIHLVDVTPLSLGIKVLGDITSKIIPRNAKLPVKRTKRYVTTVDYQTGVDIEVYEGERVSSLENHQLGKFSLENIQPAKKGIPQIIVTFSVDKNAILTVSAIDESTGNDEQLVIRTNKGRLKKKDIDRMIVEASEYKKDDENRKLVDAARHDLETLCADLHHLLDEQEDVLDYDDDLQTLDEIEEWVMDAEDADIGEYHSRYDALLKLKERLLGN